ncbi:testis-expressed protein 15 [Sorex araneus]|uniref:testis-expressed protein 15 n=1 Tax=Sorex araneus TaxID=42254 RepID=UPI002433B948|nr:testis-expressed protein 15 [Sorex araneus]
MEMKDISRHKTLWKMNPTSEPLFVTGAEVNSLKKFTIPKIRGTTEKVYLSPCYTNTREYSFIRDTLNQSRLDVSCDLQLSWQFGDTKLVHNKDLEKKFTSKRSEMRENGRHARELEEHFCFLALSQSNVAEIYKNGLSTKASYLKILGNPLLGVYVFRHVDVALNYAHSRSMTVENIMIFKVLFGKVKKIQPSLDKSKVCLDPSPNFDCHMSRNAPSLRDTIELQAHGSAVYVYEYSILSRPVDKPRQCLPYAVVTVKFIGQKDNGHLMTSLRFLSTGFPKRAERTSSLNNCTVAKRIGKGKDATVIFEHFRKPVHAFAQENCSCSTPSSEINPSNSNIPNSFGNTQNRNSSVLDTHNGRMEYKLTDCNDTSQVHTYDSGTSVISSDNKESVNGDFLSLTHLRNILRGLSTVIPLQSSVGSSTVTTSKLIKDPRLMRREENLGKHNVTNRNETLPFEKSSNLDNSKISLASVPSDSASSAETMPSNHDVFTNCLDTPCFRFSFDALQSQAQDMYSKNQDSTAFSKMTMTCQDKNSFPICLSNISSEVEDQNHNKEKAQRSQQRSSIPFFEEDSDPCNESVNTFTQGNEDPISQGSQFPHLQTDQQASTVSALQMKESTCEYMQNSGEVRNFISPEDNFNHEEKQNLWKTKISPADNYILLHQGSKENMSLDSLGEICDHVLTTQNLEIPKSSTSTTMDNYEVNHLALEFQNNLSPGVESISQKDLHHSSLCEDGIHTSSAISQKLMELKLGKPNQNYVSIMSDALQEAKDIYQANKLPFDKFISLHDVKRAHDNLDYNIAKEHLWIHRKNENKSASLENIQRSFQEIPQLDSKDQDHTLLSHAQLSNNIHMNIDFKEQRDKEKQNEAKTEEEALPSEYNRECVYVAEKQGFLTNTNSINSKDKKREDKNYSHIETLNSEEPSATFNLTWKKKVSTEITARGSEHIISAIKQKDTQNAERNAGLLSSMLPKITGSVGRVASSAAVPCTDTTLPASRTNPEDHEGHKLKASGSPDLDLFIKHKASDFKLDVDKNKLQNALCQSISDSDLVFDNFELENEIELGLEQCDDELLFQQDIPSHGNVPCEDFRASYKILKSRIDWKCLLGSKTEEREVLQNFPREENSDHFYCEQSDCFDSSPQKNQEETCNPILLPDLQVKIANVFLPGFGPTFKPLTLNDNFCRYVSGAIKPKINEEDRKVLELDIYSPFSGGNSGNTCEQECSNIRYASELVNKSEISHSFDFNHKTHMNHMSEHQNNVPWVTEASAITAISNEGTCSSTRPKTDHTRNRKDSDSGLSKRKLHISSEDQNITEKDLRHEICGKRRKLNSRNSFDCFSSLSQGRIKTFSQSEKHIRSVLDILNSEVSLCKSKRLSRKLDRAVVHLKKAHRRVYTSLQLIAKVGEARKSPLPKSYAIICNNFWESCDLLGYNPMSERRYYSTKHFLSKRKFDKPGESKALGFENYKSLTHVSKNKSSQTREERIRKCLSGNTVTSSISRNHTTIHVRGFCDQEYPESQLTVCSTSQTTAQSSYNCCNLRTLRSSAFQSIPEKNESLFSSVCPDENLTEKGNPPDTKFLSNFSKNEHLKNHLAHDPKDVTKENSSKASEVINNSESLSCMKARTMCFSTDKDFDAIRIAHTKLKTDMFISVLKSNMEHFLNVDMCKSDNRILTDFQRNLKVNFPIKKCSHPVESSKPNITTGNFLMDTLSLTLMTSKKHNNIPQLLTPAAVTDSDIKSLQTYLDKQGIFAIDSFAASTTVPSCQRGDDKKELLKTKLSPLSNCICLDYNKTNVTENSKLECPLVTKESKSCGENIISNDRSLFLKNNIKDHVSKNSIAKEDTQDIKMCKFKQTEEAKDSVHKKSMVGQISPAQIENKDQKRNILEEFSSTKEKITKNSLIDFSLSTKKISDAVSLNGTVSNQLNQRDKVEEIKVSNNSKSESSLNSETASNSKPDIKGLNHMADYRAASETSKVTVPQKKNVSHVNELKEKQPSADCATLISNLTQILRRADEASSLQILQEQTKICQNILPPFVEAFERVQECSLGQVLISRELLEQKQWNNCKHKLKPCAVDSLTELQMMMETIQFIENKKRLLQGEPTFRSLLWYDETLYSELLGRPRGFQQQSNFYPAFQGRLKYNAFCELQNYHNQLLDLFEETKRENKSYYTLLKYKRQIDECEAIMKHCSDCFDFCLSVPFTCCVNFGDDLGDLETLRKSTLKVISSYREDSPKNDAYPEKQDHLWIIIEMVSSKINFIKSNEAEGIKVSLYGMEHIFFDAAKSLVWKEKKKIFSKIYSGKKKKEMLLKMNQNSFSKLQKLYDTLSKDLNNEQISNGLKNTLITSRKPNNLINEAAVSAENYTLNSSVLSHLDICHISEIIDQAEFADFKKIQELTLRCTEQLDILKKYFQMQQEDSIDDVFITEENVLDMLKNQKHGAVILKPEAVETYIEIVMLSETVHFLKNSMAKKQDKQRFRGMLWFDLSLVPELIVCQEKMTTFSFLKENATECLEKVIETTISALNKELDIILNYNNAVNSSYALRLYSRELEELEEIKKLLKKSLYSVPTYINFVPYIASINYGSTMTELEYNYNQFSTLLKNVRTAHRKDLGKMAHITKVMKTIEHMKIICAKNDTLTISFILCQMIRNRRKTMQHTRKEKPCIPIKLGKNIDKPSTCMMVPSISECIVKNIPNSSKKRPLPADKCEDSWEPERNAAGSSFKKQKIDMEDIPKISREKTTLELPRAVRSHPRNKNEAGPSSSNNLRRDLMSPKDAETQRSLPNSHSHIESVRDSCPPKSGDNTNLTNASVGASGGLTGQEGDHMKKTDVNLGAAGIEIAKKDHAAFIVCDQKCVDGTFPKDHETTSRKISQNSPGSAEKPSPSDTQPGAGSPRVPAPSVLSKPVFRFVRDLHPNFEMDDAVCELPDSETVDSSAKNSSCTHSPETVSIQSTNPALQINETQQRETEPKEKYPADTSNPHAQPLIASGGRTLNGNQNSELSRPGANDNSKVLTLDSPTPWNGPPQSSRPPAYHSSESSFAGSYPYYTWCVYHYSSISGHSVTHTYQGVASYDVQPSPAVLDTVVGIQSTRADLSYSQYFTYIPGEPHANDFVPVTGYFRSQMPVYHFQQPALTQYHFHQPLQQASYSYLPNSGALPEVPRAYAPWQQESFRPGH